MANLSKIKIEGILYNIKDANAYAKSETYNQDEVNALLSSVESVGIPKIEVIDAIYPVGSIYISINSTNPSILFGIGEWERIEDCFLLAAGNTYAPGTTGGEAEHTLTTDELPSHTHNFTHAVVSTDSSGNHTVSNSAILRYYSATTLNATESTGNDQPHNNMPPYLAVYMWKRIS